MRSMRVRGFPMLFHVAHCSPRVWMHAGKCGCMCGDGHGPCMAHAGEALHGLSRCLCMIWASLRLLYGSDASRIF